MRGLFGFFSSKKRENEELKIKEMSKVLMKKNLKEVLLLLRNELILLIREFEKKKDKKIILYMKNLTEQVLRSINPKYEVLYPQLKFIVGDLANISMSNDVRTIVYFARKAVYDIELFLKQVKL